MTKKSFLTLYMASTAEELESIKGIEIYYEGKNHTAYFEIK